MSRRTRALIDGLKRSVPCPFCGQTDPLTLDFHHLDPDQKTAKVMRMVKDGASLARVVAEVEKCVLICANCHRRLHGGLLSAADLAPLRVNRAWLAAGHERGHFSDKESVDPAANDQPRERTASHPPAVIPPTRNDGR